VHHATTGDELPAEREWVRGVYSVLAPHMITRTYVNVVEEDTGEVAAAHGPEKYDRRPNQGNDPNNVFRRNANIKPAPQQPT